MSQKHYIIPIFVPHRGCPHDCVFCNQKKITGIEEKEIAIEVSAEDVTKKIKEYLETIPKKNVNIEVAFYGGSFTGIPIDLQKELLGAVYHFKKNGDIQGIRLSTRPDYINQEILSVLKYFGVTVIELGVQSMDEKVLKLSNRGHSQNDVYKAVTLIKENNFILGLQMMIGLPGDTKNKILRTTEEMIKLKPNMVRIYPTLVIRGTALEVLYNEGEYIPLQLEEAVIICRDILTKFKKNHIQVIRIGLQPTENIMEGKDVIAGPFHPAFRELVEAELRLDKLKRELNKLEHIPKELEIHVNPKSVSETVGLKRKNIYFLKKAYHINRILIVQDEAYNRDELKVFSHITNKDI